MKRIISLVLCILLMFSTVLVNAKVGDIVIYTKYTDVVAYINHYAIQSYNVNGSTCVGVEDLANFGFSVEWNGTNRTLEVYRNAYTNKIEQYSVPSEPNKYLVGENHLPVYETDIITYVCGNPVKSYNIGGKTVLDFESLSVFGKVEWHPEIRAIKLWVEDGLAMLKNMQKLTPVSYSYYENREGFLSVVKANLGLVGCDDVAYDISQPYSWIEGDQRTLVYIKVYVNGNIYTRAECDVLTGEIVTRNSANMSARESIVLATEYFMANCPFYKYVTRGECWAEDKDNYLVYVEYEKTDDVKKYFDDFNAELYIVNKKSGSIEYHPVATNGGYMVFPEFRHYKVAYYIGWILEYEYQDQDNYLSEIRDQKINNLLLNTAKNVGFDSPDNLNANLEVYFDEDYFNDVAKIVFYDRYTLDAIVIAIVNPENGKVYHCDYYK